MTVVREIGGCVVGLTVWGSAFGFMVHGLWTGAWYGYVFGTLLIALFSLMLLIPRYFRGRISDEELLRIMRETERGERQFCR